MRAALAAALLFFPACGLAQSFTCGPTIEAKHLDQDTRYSPASAGWEHGRAPALFSTDTCASDSSFFFSAPVAEGNYTVTVELGGPEAVTTTVRAESRRLMVRPTATAAGATAKVTFNVNVRTPQYPGGEVHRKPREMDSPNWDTRLTLEFAGDRPSVRTIKIEPASKKVATVYLAGDSTVVDQDNEPWAAWGQMLPAFFGPDIVIANHAESGETIASFESENRFAKIFATIRKGDYLFFQFAHNDQKPGPGYVSPEQYTALLRKYIGMARQRGATPVLVTSTQRRTFQDGKITDSLAPYPQLMRDLAASDHVALIDLNAMSKTLYEAVGEPNSRSLFVYAPANTYPNQTEALHDDTHFNSYGAYEMAQCVVLGIRQSVPALAAQLRKPLPTFNPAHPDDPAAVALPPTPFVNLAKPYER